MTSPDSETIEFAAVDLKLLKLDVSKLRSNEALGALMVNVRVAALICNMTKPELVAFIRRCDGSGEIFAEDSPSKEMFDNMLAAGNVLQSHADICKEGVRRLLVGLSVIEQDERAPRKRLRR
jgi:hypothetical protein